MIVVLQRVKEASVKVNGGEIAKIGKGVLLLVGFEKNEEETKLAKMAEKCVNLRIFEDEKGKMNKSVVEEKCSVLAVPNFTLAGNPWKGRRPSFDNAEKRERARFLFEKFVEELRKRDVSVSSGIFGERMEIQLINDGPVTFVLIL